MPSPRIKLADIVKLSPKRSNFVVEYVKDFSPRRAAEASGYVPEYGSKLLSDQKISDAIDVIIQHRLDVNMIDADWLLWEMIDNHQIARQQGNIAASNKALSLIGKHKRVDAFAADKIKVSTDADVVDRLVAARKRFSEYVDVQDTETTVDSDTVDSDTVDNITFLK